MMAETNSLKDMPTQNFAHNMLTIYPLGDQDNQKLDASTLLAYEI
jgi:hypothetical protein